LDDGAVDDGWRWWDGGEQIGFDGEVFFQLQLPRIGVSEAIGIGIGVRHVGLAVAVQVDLNNTSTVGVLGEDHVGNAVMVIVQQDRTVRGGGPDRVGGFRCCARPDEGGAGGGPQFEQGVEDLISFRDGAAAPTSSGRQGSLNKSGLSRCWRPRCLPSRGTLNPCRGC
jgi:hypothetical protein